jgi:hypothetical protein
MGWTLPVCASISLLLGASALMKPDSRQEVKALAMAAGQVSEATAKTAARRIDLSQAMNVNLCGGWLGVVGEGECSHERAGDCRRTAL